jgi:DNA polymerase-3 subunit epsilon
MAKTWQESTFVALDLETTGAYPLGAEICEVAAIKWTKGQIVDEFHSLVAITKPQDPKALAIHGITDEQLKSAPSLSHVITGLHKFINNSIVMAHHAQFDFGFIVPEFEKLRLPLPNVDGLCTSYLSRSVFPEAPNHKLQTLIPFLNLFQGQAHRALDDTRSCLELGLKCFAKLGADTTLEEIYKRQTILLPWNIFSISALYKEGRLASIIDALSRRESVQLVYDGGSQPGLARTVRPLGIVRNVNDDYLVAEDRPGEIAKRYFLKRISASRI